MEIDDNAPALHPELVEIASLVLHDRNEKLHGDGNIGVIGESLERYDQRKAVVVNRRNRRVEAGHGTIRAALERGATKIVVVWVDDDDDDETGYRITDNQSAAFDVSWDPDGLKLSMDEHPDIPWADLGWPDEQLDSVFADVDDGDDGDDPDDDGDDPDGDDVPPSTDESHTPDAPSYSVIVDFDNEQEQAQLLEELEGRGLKCRLIAF